MRRTLLLLMNLSLFSNLGFLWWMLMSVRTSTELGKGEPSTCMFKTNIPMYYINLDRSPERQAYMEEAFGCSGELTRVAAVDGKSENLEEMIGFGGLSGHNMTTFNEYLKKARVGAGELATTLSHVKAMKQAYDSGSEAAIIFEDDASPMLAPFWRMSLDSLKELADSEKGEWDAIQLQWSPMLSDEKEEIIRHFRANPDDAFAKKRTLAMVAYMMSRKGLARLLSHFTDEVGKFDCLQYHKRCIADTLPFAFLKAVHLSVPQMFVTRLFEGSTGNRLKGDKLFNGHYRVHMNSMLFGMQQALELWEFQLTKRSVLRRLTEGDVPDFTVMPTSKWIVEKEQEVHGEA